MKKTTLHLHIIANPAAGSGKATKVIQKASSFLENQQINYQFYLTNHAGHEKIIAQELLATTLIPWKDNADVFPLLVVLGGDGTIHEVVNTLQNNPEIPIAYLAAGSGNDFARGLDIPRDPEASLAHILEIKQPTNAHIIAAQFENEHSPQLILNNIGIGLDARIVATANKSSSKKWLNHFSLGSLTYLAAVLKVLMKQKSFPISFKSENDMRSFKNAYLCTITNHPYFGGGVAIDPTASVSQKELSLVLVEKTNIFVLIYLICRLLAKKHLSSKFIHHFKFQQLELTSSQAEYCQTDGEIKDENPQTISCEMTSHLFWY